MKVGNSIRDATLRELFDFYNPRMLYSTPDYRTELLGRPINKVPITDFFGLILDIHLQEEEEAYPILEDILYEEGQTKDSQEQRLAVFDFNQNHKNVSAADFSPTVERPHQHEKFEFSKHFLVSCFVFVVSCIFITSSHI